MIGNLKFVETMPLISYSVNEIKKANDILNIARKDTQFQMLFGKHTALSSLIF